MISTHYADFIKEYKGYEYVENTHSFVTYRKCKINMNVEIGDLFTQAGQRSQGKASELVQGLEKDWRAEGYTYMYTYIYNEYYQKEQSLVASLKYGMKIINQDGVRMTLGKEI